MNQKEFFEFKDELQKLGLYVLEAHVFDINQANQIAFGDSFTKQDFIEFIKSNQISHIYYDTLVVDEGDLLDTEMISEDVFGRATKQIKNEIENYNQGVREWIGYMDYGKMYVVKEGFVFCKTFYEEEVCPVSTDSRQMWETIISEYEEEIQEASEIDSFERNKKRYEKEKKEIQEIKRLIADDFLFQKHTVKASKQMRASEIIYESGFGNITQSEINYYVDCILIEAKK